MLRVGFVQTAPVVGDLDGNRERLLARTRQVDADLLVLPELCQSGYVFSSREEAYSLSEPIPAGPTSQALAALAGERRQVIVAGICERDGDRLYNSAAVFAPAGHLLTYRKIHLFKEEKLWFEPGPGPFRVVDLGGVRLGVLVCYDWRFPEAARSLALLGADIIAHPANLVLPFCQEVMRARCIENRVFAITANRVGTDARPDGQQATFTGRSQVVDPDGEVLVRASIDGEESAVFAVDPSEARQKSFSPQNHILRDRRPECYGLLLDERPPLFELEDV
jgi:predicted amidohydrolase